MGELEYNATRDIVDTFLYNAMLASRDVIMRNINERDIAPPHHKNKSRETFNK